MRGASEAKTSVHAAVALGAFAFLRAPRLLEERQGDDLRVGEPLEGSVAGTSPERSEDAGEGKKARRREAQRANKSTLKVMSLRRSW